MDAGGLRMEWARRPVTRRDGTAGQRFFFAISGSQLGSSGTPQTGQYVSKPLPIVRASSSERRLTLYQHDVVRSQRPKRTRCLGTASRQQSKLELEAPIFGKWMWWCNEMIED